MTAEGHADRWRSLLLRLVRFTGRTLRAEWHAIVVEPVHRLTRRGLSALLLGFVAACGVIFFHDIAQHPLGRLWVQRLGGVTGDLPLWLALLRTPVSLYVPALDLPVWAGITSLFLSFALAELILGRVRTLAIAYVTTLAGTLIARVMIALGPGWWGFGLPHAYGRVLDTGPSAAVVGLFTYLSVIRRAPVVFTLTGGSMLWESVAVPNLAGREHLVAVGTAIALALLHGRRPGLRAYVRSLLPRRHHTPAPAAPRPGIPAPAPARHHDPGPTGPRRRDAVPAEMRNGPSAPAGIRHRDPGPAEPCPGSPVPAATRRPAPGPAGPRHRDPVLTEMPNGAPAPAGTQYRDPAPAEPCPSSPVPAETRRHGPGPAGTRRRGPDSAEARDGATAAAGPPVVPAPVLPRAASAPVAGGQPHDAAMTSLEC
ncbi:hypothetical protein [Streptomyces sp. NPDC001851]|uniref:hypothetical protein n=1 Tax=Streptomyces sp. NPDC001851 TaxID=3154529 RepID=UPI00332DA4A0